MASGLSFEVNTYKTYLSSESKIYKTERFLFATKKISEINFFILKIAETIQANLLKIREKFSNVEKFKIETTEGNFEFFVYILNQRKFDLQQNDIVFFACGEFEGLKQNDQRINFFLKNAKRFTFTLSPVGVNVSESDFKKLYLVSALEYVNLPMLSSEQQKLVEIENENVLIQGVAGSGKTNICYSKIIFTACKSYTGKVLYTTFSRGLLIDTKNKIELYKNSVKNLIDDYRAGRIVFLDKNHKKAFENRLGIYIVAGTETNLIDKLQSISEFLSNNIDYKLIEDLHSDYFSGKFEISDETLFCESFLKQMSNHQLKSKLEKIKNISSALIYKEVYGMIFGSLSESGGENLTLEEYKNLRKNSFTDSECEIIFDIAMQYRQFQKTQNLIDNNEISRKILKNTQKIQKYSLIIADEVQDFTQINLVLLKNLSLKMFCVGDALQMINPSYFSFAFLKKLMYNEDVTNVAELQNNYRSNKKIVEVLSELSKLNKNEFGTHSFVLENKCIDDNTNANTIFVSDRQFFDKLRADKFEDFTLLVSDLDEKQKLREFFPKQEILTVAEIKGLERETIVLVNLLSSSADKWSLLERIRINHKQADENSVFRYYFNLFYVGVSRAKHNLFVFESEKISAFEDFFKKNFDILSANDAFLKFQNVVSKLQIDEDEIYERIEEFIKLGQFDNAKFYAEKLGGVEKYQQLEKIDAFKYFVFKNRNREAGIKLWKAGLTADAKKQFEISGDTKLIEFLTNLESRNQTNLDGEIVKFWQDFEDNDMAKNLIIQTLASELDGMRQTHREDREKLKKILEAKNGK